MIFLLERYILSEHYYNENCPTCKTLNLIYLGDTDDNDPSKLDIEGIKCVSCGRIFIIGGFDEEEFLKDFQYDSVEDIYYEDGQYVQWDKL